MFVLPADENAVGIYILSVALHILIPSLMVIAFLLYINHEVATKFMVTTDKQLVWVRCAGLLLSALFSFGYLAYYVPVSETTCQVTVAIFQALPAVSKFFVDLFYALRYRNIAKELNLPRWPVQVFFPLSVCNLFIGWIPYWIETTFVDENGLCVGLFGDASLSFIGVFMVLDIFLGSFMLYMFAKPFLAHEQNRQKTASSELQSIQDNKASNGSTQTKKHSAFRSVLRTAFLSSALSLLSTVFTTLILAFAFYWTPTLPVLFASDIASLIDAAVSCTILLYSYKDFNSLFCGICKGVIGASSVEQKTNASSAKAASQPPAIAEDLKPQNSFPV
jgi:hypothetical protein